MSSGSAGATEDRCPHCGEVVDKAASFCSACGRALPSGQMAQGSGENIYLALVMANVLRLRRQWALAEAKCSDVLGRDPNNAEAYSVLGDIARDQGKLRDAVEWYKMALDRKPGNVSDREKLEAVIDQLYPGQGQSLMGRARTAVGGKLGPAAAGVRTAGLPSPMPFILGAVLAVMLLIAVSAIVVGRGAGAGSKAAAREGSSGGFVGAEAAQAGTRAEEPKRAEATAPAVAEFGEEAALLEGELLKELRLRASAVDPNCQVVSVEIDPRDSTVSLRLSMPRLWSSADTRQTIVRAAAELGAHAAKWDERVSRVRVRCDMRQPGLGDSVGLVAEGSAESLAKEETGIEAALEDSFESVWWHPELRAGVKNPLIPGAE